MDPRRRGCRRHGQRAGRWQSHRCRPVRHAHGKCATRHRAGFRGARTKLMGNVAKVVTFGEIMLRLSPPGSERFLQSPQFVATFGGGEANVAVSLARFGLESWYVTRLPKHAIGDAAVSALRAEGVRTDAIVRGGDRIGVYFAESGASQRGSVVIYDRARSAISEMEATAVPWASVMAGAHWYHVTGITPALGANG